MENIHQASIWMAIKVWANMQPKLRFLHWFWNHSPCSYFQTLIEGAQKIMCTQCTFQVQSPLYMAGAQGPLKGSGICKVLDALSCYPSIILKHFDIKLDKRKLFVDQNVEPPPGTATDSWYVIFTYDFSCEWPMVLYTFKKVTQHDFNQLYQFVDGFVFITLGIIWKLGYLSFHWYFIFYECFAETWAGR